MKKDHVHIQPFCKALSGIISGRLGALKGENFQWFDAREREIAQIESDCLMSGSGFDSGTTVDLDKSTSEKIVLNSAYHTMDDSGMYGQWIDLTITIVPSLQWSYDFKVNMHGFRDTKGHREYIESCVETILSADLEKTYSFETEETTLRLIIK